MDSIKEFLSLNYLRRFGVEIEVNSFDMLSRPIGYQEGKLPVGIHYIGNTVQKITQERVLIHKWGHDHDNDIWIIKPDGSCGIEVCTPVLKGWNGILRVCRVVDAFNKDPKINSDNRCSFHVHVDVSDLVDKLSNLASVLTWWLKCEPVFLDSVPPNRKKNQYCQFLGELDLFDEIENGFLPPEVLIRKLGLCKYYTVNTLHYYNEGRQPKRKTIEFRIMDNECCLNSWMAKNWIRLIIHFVECAVKKGMPTNYEAGNPFSGYCWLDPINVFDFLGFLPDQADLSPGLKQVREWFATRLFIQSQNIGLNGIMGNKARRFARKEIEQLYSQFGRSSLISDNEIYSENFRI